MTLSHLKIFFLTHNVFFSQYITDIFSLHSLISTDQNLTLKGSKEMKIIVFMIMFMFLIEDEVVGWRRRRRRRRSPPPCRPVNCAVSGWSSWSGCTHQCGSAGTQTRRRTKSRGESCGGNCPYQLSETRACNRDACKNGGTPISGRCSCTSAWRGTCCETGV